MWLAPACCYEMHMRQGATPALLDYSSTPLWQKMCAVLVLANLHAAGVLLVLVLTGCGFWATRTQV